MPSYRFPPWGSISGPVVDLSISSGSSTRTIEAIIDSGADMTCIPNVVANDLNLQQISVKPATGFTGTVASVPVYRVDLSFEGMSFPNWAVLGYGNMVLIGRDILNRLITHLDGPAQDFTLQ